MANYINKEELVFEVIVSKGRGKVSDKLNNYFWLISNRIAGRFNGNDDMKEDQIMEAYCCLLESWYNANEYKSNLMEYYSEVAKRAYVKVYNIYMDRKLYRYRTKEKYIYESYYVKPNKISMTDIYLTYRN